MPQRRARAPAAAAERAERLTRPTATATATAQGILYGGFMATARGVYVIEYNARLGDPEAMNALALLDSDFGAICEGIADGSLATVDVRFSNLASCCVYAVPDGYPAAGVKGAPIDLSALTPEQHRTLYFASVDERVGGELVTCGSRAIGSCVCAPTLDEASALATAPLAAMKGALWFRRDIGTEGPVRSRVGSMIAHRRAAPRPGCVKLAVLGSTRGSALQPVLEAIASGELNACIELVVSNKRDAPILARAEGHGLRSAHLPAPKDCSREDYDRALSVLLEASGAQLILAVGWMRILSPWCAARARHARREMGARGGVAVTARRGNGCAWGRGCDSAEGDGCAWGRGCDSAEGEWVRVGAWL